MLWTLCCIDIIPGQCSTVTAAGFNESRAGPHMPSTTSVACSVSTIFAIFQWPTRIGSCVPSVGVEYVIISCWLLNPQGSNIPPQFHAIPRARALSERGGVETPTYPHPLGGEAPLRSGFDAPLTGELLDKRRNLRLHRQ